MDKNKHGPDLFDEWAPAYDQEVQDGQAAGDFPFDGYQRILDEVFDQAQTVRGMSVVDLGMGTGSLGAPFIRAGCQVFGMDFSSEMLSRARIRLPGVPVVQASLLDDLEPVFRSSFGQTRFDRLVSAYVFHHFDLQQKISLLRRLADRHLAPGGMIVVGDIAYQTSADLQAARRQKPAEWDNEEDYWDASKAVPALEAAGLQCRYRQVSSCAGVFRIQPVRQTVPQEG